MSSPGAVTAHVGTNQLDSNGDSYQAEKIVSHPKYNSFLIINDVALIRVNRNIAMSANVKPITLAMGSNTYEGSSCVLSGWGTTKVSDRCCFKGTVILEDVCTVTESKFSY